jgi:peptide/nickel transport system ATP-binding protein
MTNAVRESPPVDRPVPDPLLEVRDLTVTYGAGDAAVRAASFGIAPGERVALVGESGSGKTTLALAVAGFLDTPGVRVDGGITFGGTAVDRTPHALPRRVPGISMMFQDAMTSLDPVWTVGSQLRDVIRSTSSAGRKEALDRSRGWLVKVGLTDTARVMAARPYELSGGMRQRVMLALALAGGPRLVIADEPTSALDASLARTAMDLLTELTAEFGTSLLMVSHDIHLCAEYSDRTLVMYRGDLVGDAPSTTLGGPDAHPYVQGLLRCVPTLDDVDVAELPTLDAFVGGTA